jgi:lectin-like protein
VHWLALIALLASCGRYGFDRAGDANRRDDGSPSDGAAIGNDIGGTGTVTCLASYPFSIGSSRYRAGGQTSWTAAEASCEADGAGMHLVVIDDAGEMSALASLAGGARTWVGASDRVTDNVFLRVTGRVATYLPWRSGDPSLVGPGCAAWDSQAAQYREESCTQGRQFLCECDGIAADLSAY